MMYKPLETTVGARITSFAWATNVAENPDYAHICGYCFYDEKGNCPTHGPEADLIV